MPCGRCFERMDSCRPVTICRRAHPRRAFRGGVHVQLDDLHGREIGYEVGHEAVAVARAWFEGAARP